MVNICTGIEARGFIFGPPIALDIGAKFVPMRKPKKLPGNLLLLYEKLLIYLMLKHMLTKIDRKLFLCVPSSNDNCADLTVYGGVSMLDQLVHICFIIL